MNLNVIPWRPSHIASLSVSQFNAEIKLDGFIYRTYNVLFPHTRIKIYDVIANDTFKIPFCMFCEENLSFYYMQLTL